MIYDRYARYQGFPSQKIYVLLKQRFSVTPDKGGFKTEATTVVLLDVNAEQTKEVSYDDFKKSIEKGSLIRITK